MRLPPSAAATALAFFLVCSASVSRLVALPTLVGDLDEDGRPTVLDLARLHNHLNHVAPLADNVALFADVNNDGFLNEADSDALVRRILGAANPAQLPLATVRSSSPAFGEAGVALTRETVVYFSIPLSLSALLTTNHLQATFAGRPILARVELSSERTKATLFYQEPLPARARVRVTFNGTGLTDLLGRPLDPDGDGTAGGSRALEFDTISITPVPGTRVVGQVLASELQPGSGTETATDLPLAGVTITVDGAEQSLRCVTDAQGRFTLTNSPAGRFFVLIDGRTTTTPVPAGAYYPFVGKAWTAIPGVATNLATPTGKIYLPLIKSGTLQAVGSAETTIAPPSAVVTANPAFAGVRITVPGNSLFSDNGTRGGQVGIAPVPASRLPEPLPPGLNIPIVVTVQTDGPSNFDRPVPARFPNLPDPDTGETLPPGAKTALWSFDHDLGKWQVVGPMTVTADGNYVETDLGVGILQPGWHGPSPGSPAGGGPGSPSAGDGGPSGPGSPGGPYSGGGGGGGDPPPPPPPCPDQASGIRAAEANCALKAARNGAKPLVKFAAKNARNPLGGILKSIGQRLMGKDTFLDEMEREINAGLDCQRWACECAEQMLQLGRDCSFPRVEFRGPSGPPPDPFVILRSTLDGLRSRVASQIALERQMYAIVGTATNEAQLSAAQLAQLRPLIAQFNRQFPGETLLDVYANELNGIDAAFQSGVQQNLITYSSEAAHFALVDEEFGLVRRGRTEAGGAVADLILAPNRIYRLIRLFPSTLHLEDITFLSRQSGQRTQIPAPGPTTYIGGDNDNDDLADLAEFVVGTSTNSADSDGDGILDGAEIRSGNDPLGGLSAQTGLIAAQDTPGSAVDVAAARDIAVVADRTEGITVFTVADRLNPVRLTQVPVPGANIVSVALAGNLIAAANMAGDPGLLIFDATVPAQTRLIRSINLGPATAVTLAGPIAYVGLNSGTVVAIDVESGEELDRAEVSKGPIQDLVLSGDSLFAASIGAPVAFHELILDGGELAVARTISQAGSNSGQVRFRLFAGGSHAYLTHAFGFNLINIAAPGNPLQTRTFNDGQAGWRHLVSNGNGLGVAVAGSSGADDNPKNLQLFDLTNPSDPQYLGAFPTGGFAESLTLSRDLAFVACKDLGFQIFTYRDREQGTVAPTLTLSANFDLTPTARAESGALLRITALAQDNVMVRNVELRLDGVLFESDDNFPYEFRFRGPIRTADRTSFRMQCIAFDTAGNRAASPEYVVQLLNDLSPPRVTKVFPRKGAFRKEAPSVSVRFSETIQIPTLTSASFFVTQLPGNDPSVTTGTPVPGTIEWIAADSTALLTFNNAPTQALYRVDVIPPIADLNSNAVTPFTSHFRVTGTTDDDDGDGLPNDLELALGFDPNNPADGAADADGDGLSNAGEFASNTDLFVADTDGDGILDGAEDDDLDGATLAEEFAAGSHPALADTDADGWLDGDELISGSNPTLASSKPSSVLASGAVQVHKPAPLQPNGLGYTTMPTGARVVRLPGPFAPGNMSIHHISSSRASFLPRTGPNAPVHRAQPPATVLINP